VKIKVLDAKEAVKTALALNIDLYTYYNNISK
jgi:hypothetical protein